MKSGALTFALFSVVILGCTKDVGVPEPENPPSSCVCLKENKGIPFGNGLPCFGFLTISTYTDLTRDKAFSLSMNVMAYFNNNPDRQINGNFVTVDSVLLDRRSVPIVNDAYATIYDGSGKTYWNVSVIIKEGSNEVCFPEEIKLLGPGKATLSVDLENLVVQPFSSKNFMFSKQLHYIKEITLVP